MKKTTLQITSLLTLLLFIAIPFSVLAQSPKTYSASGTFTVPAGVTTIGVQAWGAGGGGSTRTTNGRGGGGGGGAFAANPSTTVSALSGAYSITVGTGGGGNTAGGNSSFSTNVIAIGGSPGANDNTGAGAGGTDTASTGTVKYSGGNGAAGGVTNSGAGGGGAGSGSVGLPAALAVGGIGGTGGGGTGANGVSGNTIGLNGNTFGGGGSGAVRTTGTKTGGSGANGQVIITWANQTYSITSTAIASPLCTGSPASITLTGGAGLPIGNYTVTYSLTGTNTATNATATMSVTTAGTGSFTTSTLSNIGLTNIQITNLSSGVSPDNCTNAISSGNTASVTLTAVPAQPSAITGSTSFCGGTSQSYSVTNVAGVTYTWSFPAGWSKTAGGTTNAITVTTNGTSGTVTVTPSNACGNGTAQTLAVTSNAPTANAGSALATICQGQTSVALGGSFGGGAMSAIWSDGGVGGTFTNNTGSTPNTTTWTPPGAYLGTATLTLTTSGGSCGTTTASKTQVVATGAFATISSSAITVNGSLTSAALGGSPASGTWTKVSGPSGTVTFSNASSGSSTATVPTIGTYVFRWTITSSCGTSSADIAVTYIDANYHRDYTLFYEDFDATDGGWTNTTNTNGSWTRTDTFTGVAEIGENSFWRTNNFNDYSNNAVIEITSPVYDFTGYENLLFNIDIRYQTQQDNDGMRILYSINNGAFVLLGSSGSGINWYNSTSVSALGSNGWSNNSATATLAFTPIGVGANRFLRATTQLVDGTFRNQSNVRFKVEFRSNSSTTDNGVAFDNVALEGNAIVALVASPIAPANINQNLRLWFKSNAGIAATDGTPLTAWEDQAYDTTRADLVNKESVKALATDAPTFRDNSSRNLNFNPVVDFSSANKDYMNGKGGLYSQDYFVVVYPDDVTQNTMGTNGRQIPLGGKSDEQSFHEDPTGLGLGNTTARYSTAEVIAHNVGAYAPGTGSPTPGVDSYGRSFSSTTVTYNEPLIINVKTNASGTQTEIYKNGIKIDNLAGKTGDTGTGNLLDFYEYKNLPFYLGTGRSGISGRAFSALNGRLSEVAVYTAPNSALNQQKIQSYLGIKYGITLHATTSSNVSGVSLTTRLNDVDYIDSAGNIIWNTIGNTGYNYDITGIGRDDDSQLYQKQSKTVNTTDDITIGLNTIAATNNLNPNTCNNRNFLVWGNNQGTLAAQAPVMVDMSTGITPALSTNVEFVSVGRTWKVVEVGGNVPTARVSIPSIMLTATITPPGDYLMFISDTPVFNPTAEYRVMTVNGSNLETSYDFDGTKYITFGYAPERTYTRCIKFNGSTDYLDAGKVLDLTPAFTVSAWVNRTTAGRTIFSKRNSTFTEGYDLSINAAGRAEMSWFVGASKKTITSSAVIPTGIWHHIGVSFDGTTAKMYIDGINAVSNNLAGTPTAATNQSFLIAAADGVSTTSFFNGSIDEVRVWNVALTDAQFRYVMNQEILKNGTATNGAIVPNTITLNNISVIPWANLMAYYPMSTYTYTNAKDISNNNYTAALRNVVTVDRQTAPLPYESATSAPWESVGTWTNSSLQYIPNSTSIEDATKTIDWNIIKSTHDISSSANKTVLGLFVNSGTISATSNTKIEVSHYLKLDGKIDLVGQSQLVQTLGSDLDVTSSGSIERDQQGQSNKYNYNYWSSPVSPINNTANNTNYTVAGIMKDGFNSTPRSITWNTTYDGVAGNAGTAVSLARYWLYTFDNKVDTYANWQQITEAFSLRVGQGYTLKGAGAATNFTFVGKPNNGTITSNTVSANQLSLVGNPYPSAIDGYQFINDNANINKGTGNGVATDGTLYFWEHSSSNTSHVLWEYTGGYGVLNLTGGLAPVAPAGINGIGASAKTPKQFIPVGQGFFVYGNGTGGAINFNNGQRAFVKETDATSTTLFKTKANTKTAKATNANEAEITYKKIRLGYNNKDNYHRQVLLGFMDDKATSDIDYGYDSEIMDDFANDMYFLNSDKQLVIQGDSYFNNNATYPIGVKTDAEGKVNFVIDELENFDAQQPIFIHDNLTDTYHDIRTQNYEVTLPVGTNNSRFSLRFTDKTLKVAENTIDGIIIAYIQKSNLLEIRNPLPDITVEKLTLFNILGQEMTSWKIDNQEQQNIRVPIKTVSAGVYIVKVKTSKGESSKKIIVN